MITGNDAVDIGLSNDFDSIFGDIPNLIIEQEVCLAIEHGDTHTASQQSHVSAHKTESLASTSESASSGTSDSEQPTSRKGRRLDGRKSARHPSMNLVEQTNGSAPIQPHSNSSPVHDVVPQINKTDCNSNDGEDELWRSPA
jgi:hypothetical protein